MELNIRRLQESDWEVLPTWWEKWEGWKTPDREALPDNGLCGLMVHKGDKKILAGFMYTTNSKGAWVEYIISDPDYREKDRQKALDLFVKAQGFKYILFVGKNKNLINTFENNGWFVDKTPSYELMKKI